MADRGTLRSSIGLSARPGAPSSNEPACGIPHFHDRSMLYHPAFMGWAVRCGPQSEVVMFESDAFRNVWAPRLLSIVRIFVGLLYMEHGLSKYFGFPGPQPQHFQVLSLIGLAGAIEIVGGLMLTLGLYTRWVAFIMSGEMAVAFLIVRHRLSVSFFPAVNGGELEALYCFFFFAFFLVGGGAWSLDRQRKRA